VTSILRIVVVSIQSVSSIVKNSGRCRQVVVMVSDSHKISQFVKYANYSLKSKIWLL